ncbi:DUF721 domain-containing protein [Oceanibacterium hippocampi]|uniref:Zn-ribbon-containing, possibly RNA-binding protein and truncated derivatives n=1 Tax=Oceanibacterium hippocampi TaxID=745714 RepID=A0A1Y5S736_9PROT|nr:DciA family protein [Oceanibacterium hippocampi]SLN33937.1 hypothetical protein OCH7691_01311 [Oceanibacterium hippocampi]
MARDNNPDEAGGKRPARRKARAGGAGAGGTAKKSAAGDSEAAKAAEKPRRGGARTLGRLVPEAARGAFRRRGFSESAVLLRWPEIAGPTIAGFARPERMSYPPGKGTGATLHLRVAIGRAPEVQHLAPLIVERINAFYGYGAVARLAIVQAPLPPQAPTKPGRRPTPLDPAEEKRLAALLAGIADDGLRRALDRLGRSVIGTRSRNGD